MTAKRHPGPRNPVKLIGDILTGRIEDRAPGRSEDPTKIKLPLRLAAKAA